jgi:quercetin 2,3-dioxygenase
MSMSRRDVLKAAAVASAAGGLAACAGGVKSPAGLARAAAIGSAGGALVPASAMVLRPAGERGHANYGWLDTSYTFSFASYYDPRHMGFRDLRVINDDHIAAAGGFPMHPHNDMEIITYVLEGALEHKDTLGNGGVIRPNDVQRMSAGTGIRHSEFNPSRSADVHLLQIWIEPDERGVSPGYDQRVYPTQDRTNRLRLVASGNGRDGSIRIHSTTNLHATILEPGRTVAHAVDSRRSAWIHVARGELEVNGVPMRGGDGLAVTAAGMLEIKAAAKGAEVLVFDLA